MGGEQRDRGQLTDEEAGHMERQQQIGPVVAGIIRILSVVRCSTLLLSPMNGDCLVDSDNQIKQALGVMTTTIQNMSANSTILRGSSTTTTTSTTTAATTSTTTPDGVTITISERTTIGGSKPLPFGAALWQAVLGQQQQLSASHPHLSNPVVAHNLLLYQSAINNRPRLMHTLRRGTVIRKKRET